MRIIGISDLVTDYYYLNDKLLGACGGGTAGNIIANLSNMGFDASVIGGCGNDSCGQIAIDSLNKVGVKTDNIIRKNISTRKFHIRINMTDGVITSVTKKRCPICNGKDWYTESIFEPNEIKGLLKNDDIIVVDSLSTKSKDIIDERKKINDIMLDLGYYHRFLYLKLNDIVDMLSGNFVIVNMNERVARYLSRRFKIDKIQDFNSIINTKLLIITRGNKGADFLFNDKIIAKKLVNKSEEVDTNGAGDAFFAALISEYINNNRVIDENMVERAFISATNLTRKVVASIGARSHMMDLYKVESIPNICTCKNVTIKNCNF